MSTYYVDGAVGNDSNAGTSPGSGNAWATIGHALSTMSAGDLAWVKASATYSISTGLTMGQSSLTAITRVYGYTSTPGDNGQATIQATAAVNGLTMSGYGCRFANFVLDGNSTGLIGLNLTGNWSISAVNCTVKNWTTYGIYFATAGGTTGNVLVNVTVTGCTGSYAVLVHSSCSAMYACSITGNTGHGAYIDSSDTVGFLLDGCTISGNGGDGIHTSFQPNCDVVGCIVSGNTGSGIYFAQSITRVVRNCTIHGNGSDGLYIGTYFAPGTILNSLFTSNGGYGLNASAMSPGISDPCVDYNWFGSGGLANTSGPRNIILAGPHDLSGDPQYVNASAGNFTPQNSAVQAAFPSGWIGAVQPASSGGSAVFSPIGCAFIKGL